MNSHDAVEEAVPTQIVKGDVIHDPVGDRWMTVTEIRTLSDVGSGAYSFYGDGPDDRVTFEGGEPVNRRPWMGQPRR